MHRFAPSPPTASTSSSANILTREPRRLIRRAAALVQIADDAELVNQALEADLQEEEVVFSLHHPPTPPPPPDETE